ncbi:hypothetical protein B1B04_10515 [Lysinibacillus sp. KCTC 33748]|uniref:hypothetical protein n=1 Tax=unclassified Lysinibacillus TaxID=2636778 RepID=UPI0009A76443|nr:MULTISPECIES: hypothetical protein [unclassified Lysinibacillus]OXS74038.1 hypothetical protein B1B04_10515 [Lysinibacillus sp. KCTC 33748]SKB69648.1 hypothetical protein SAMN06295926_10663 [Lysinibacillus sp. AC-3]
MDSIRYYVVQVNDLYYQGEIDLQSCTDDEEQAFTFTDIVAANELAHEINGIVLTRDVSYKELEDLSAQYLIEYEALPKEERDTIESFCRELSLGMFE